MNVIIRKIEHNKSYTLTTDGLFSWINIALTNAEYCTTRRKIIEQNPKWQMKCWIFLLMFVSLNVGGLFRVLWMYLKRSFPQELVRLLK